MKQNKRYCPTCGKEVRVSRLFNETSVVCDTCHFNCIGLNDEVLKLFRELPPLPSAEDFSKMFAEAWKSFHDTDYKYDRGYGLR